MWNNLDGMCKFGSSGLKINSRSGLSLIDVMVATFLLGVCGLIFAASFASAYALLSQSNEHSLASRVCRDETEAVRSLGYGRLTIASLTAAGAIDPNQESAPYSITQAKSLATSLPHGSGQMSITQESAGLKRVIVTVSWQSSQGVMRAVTVTSFVADKTSWTK